MAAVRLCDVYMYIYPTARDKCVYTFKGQAEREAAAFISLVDMVRSTARALRGLLTRFVYI